MADCKRILVVKLSSLGDTLHALPAVAELKEQLGAEIHWAVQPAFAALVRCFACVDKVIEIPRPSKFSQYVAAVRRLRKERYDMAVDFQGLLKSAATTRFARAQRRIGPSFAREGSRHLYDEVAGKLNKNRHAIDECLDIVWHLGLAMPAAPKFPLSVPGIDLDDQAPLSHGGPRIAVAPLSRWESKNWPEHHFAKLISILVQKHDARLYVIGGPGDRDTSARIIADAGVDAANLCGRHSLAETLGVISQCSALVSNDSGPMHMGVALGVKCVVPFGPTLPERTGPYGSQHVTLRDPNCPPCRKRVCPKGTKACLEAITPEIIEAAIFPQKS